MEKKVTREEFKQFVKDYPRKLEWDVIATCEPPLGIYFDETLGDPPDGKVASIIMGWLGPNGEIDNDSHGKYWEYSIWE